MREVEEETGLRCELGRELLPRPTSTASAGRSRALLGDDACRSSGRSRRATRSTRCVVQSEPRLLDRDRWLLAAARVIWTRPSTQSSRTFGRRSPRVHLRPPLGYTLHPRVRGMNKTTDARGAAGHLGCLRSALLARQPAAATARLGSTTTGGEQLQLVEHLDLRLRQPDGHAQRLRLELPGRVQPGGQGEFATVASDVTRQLHEERFGGRQDRPRQPGRAVRRHRQPDQGRRQAARSRAATSCTSRPSARRSPSRTT